MISSSRSTLCWFLSLYAALYAGFGVQSPYLPILLDNRHLSPETVALALAAGTAMRLTAAPVVARLADRFDAPRAILALCSAAAGLIGLGYLPAQGAWALIALGVVHTAALAPLPPLSDTLALGTAGPIGSGGMPRWKFHYGWLRGCGSAAFVVGLVMSGQAIGHFGIVVIVWLNTALLLAASPVALGVQQTLTSGGHSRATASHAGGVLALLRLPLYRKMVLLVALILGSHAMHDSFAMIRWSRAGISPGTSGVLWSLSVAAEVVVFVVVGRPLLDRIGPAGAAVLSAGAGVVRMGGNGRDRLAACAGVDRAVARPDLRTLASDVHAAVGTMRSKTPRGDGTDHLRDRRHRCCDRSAYACLRADFRALWGARVLGNGGSLCRGVAAHPNSARTNGRFRVIFFARPII
jgi:MFS transporter, PPP family, 3-phenylpropionic acid transporter